MTDTGVLGKRRFLGQVRDYQRTLARYGHEEWVGINQYRLDHKGERKSWAELRTRAVPTFNFVPAAGTVYLRAVVVEAGIIGGMAVLFFMLSYLAFLRYDVR